MWSWGVNPGSPALFLDTDASRHGGRGLEIIYLVTASLLTDGDHGASVRVQEDRAPL